MANVIFYEKPGCQGNFRQKEALIAAGHMVEARDLISEAWSEASLFAFLAARPVAEWFNPNAPAVRDGRLDPQRFSADEALVLLLANPLLIRRPLLQVGEQRRVGFEVADIDAWIGLNGVELRADDHVFGPNGQMVCAGHADGEGMRQADHGRCGRH